MKRTLLNLVTLLSLSIFPVALHGAETETPCFRIEGLKYVETVHLDVTGSKATGDYLVDEYGQDSKRFRFTGKVVPNRAGKKGVYIAITFNKEDLGDNQQAAYTEPPGANQIVWVLRIVDRHAHLFIPTYERFNDAVPAHYAVTELEYLPCDKAGDH